MVVITALAAVGSTVAASAIGTALGIAGVTSTLALAGIGLATNLVLGLALNALTPRPSISSAAGSRGYQVNSRGSALDHQIIYGQARVGGVVVYDETTGSENKYLHRIIAVAGHEVESFEEIYLNDELLTIDGSGNVTSPSRYNGKVRIKTHLGSPDQLADGFLVNESAHWTSNHRLRGIAYMYVRLAFDADVFPNGVPVFTATVKGKKVYNPATAVTEWSDNPALCLRDYLTATGYGLGEDAANIDDDLVIAAAAVCDQTNTVAGTTRYTCNGNFTTALTPYDLITNLLTSMGGSLWYSQGKWRMKPAYWTTPVLYLNEDDLRSSISVSTRHSRRDNFNTVKGTFRGAESNWQVTDYPEVVNVTNAGFFKVGGVYAISSVGSTDFTAIGASSNTVGEVFTATGFGSGSGTADANLGADNGQVSVVDIDLPFTDNSIEARRIARIALESNRQQLMVSASFGLRALAVQVGDNVFLTNSRFGWINKEFQVVSWSFGLTDGLDLQVEMMLKETAESVFDEVDDGIVYERDNTTLLSPFDAPIPSLDVATVSTSVNTDGTTIPIIDFSWSVTGAERVDYYDFQWKLTGASEYNSVSLTEPRYTLSPALSLASYDYRVRSVNVLGVKSTFVSSVSPVSTGDDGTIPNAPTNVTVQGGYASATVTWDAPTTNTDASAIKDLFQYKIYRGTSSNPTTLVGRVSGEIFTDSGLSDNTTYYYRVKATDFTGNESAYSTEGSATTNPQLQNGADGPRGAGRWNIGVTTLPTTSSGANTDFVAAIGTPVDKDQAWFYTGTESSPASQSVWIYDLGTTSWIEQTEAIDGNLVVSGTITAGKLNVTDLSAISANLGTISVGSANIANAAIETAKIANGAVTNRFAAFTASDLTPTGTYQLLQSVTIDCDGNPVSVLFNAGVDGITSLQLDVRLDGVSQRTFNASSGFYVDPSGFSGTAVISLSGATGSGGSGTTQSGFVNSVPSSHSHAISNHSHSVSLGGTAPVSIDPGTLEYYETTATVAMTISPAAGSRTVSVYGRQNGGQASSPVVRNRYLETTELKR